MKSLSKSRPAQSAGEKAILDAAARLFSEQGYDGVSMRAVAGAAGVSKANIYHHFESKEALYRAILQQSAARLTALVEGLEQSEGTIAERIASFADAHLDQLFSNAMTARLMLRESCSADEDRGRQLAEQVVGENFRRMAVIFQQAQADGLIRADLDPGLCATLLMGADVFYFQAQGILQHIPEARFSRQPEAYSREMVGILLRGMLNQAAGREELT